MATSLFEGYSVCTMRVRSEGEGELQVLVNSAYSYSAVVDVEDWRGFCTVQYYRYASPTKGFEYVSYYHTVVCPAISGAV